MSCVDIRGCRIGEGRPKVILPIVERAEAAILEKAAQFSTLQADCVEWRINRAKYLHHSLSFWRTSCIWSCCAGTTK